MSRLIDLLESWVRAVGKAVAWLLIVLLAVILWDVGMRYAFKSTSAFFFELEWHLFSLIFLLAAGYTLQTDKHVRVDVWYQNFSPKTKAWVNLIGTIVLLFPLCWVGITQSWPFVKTSYLLQEISPDKGGLPARFLIKSCIPLGFLLLGIQGIVEIFRHCQTLLARNKKA